MRCIGFFDPPSHEPSSVQLDGVVGAWSGSRMHGGASIVGGQVVLTRDHFVFSPWDMDQTRRWLVTLLGAAGVPHVGPVDKLLSATRLLEPVAIPLTDIADAQVLNRASFFKAPRVRLTLYDGNHFDLGILAGPLKRNGDPANNLAFDDFLSKLPLALP